MHHKRLLSGPFRVKARRSPCVQTPLCPPRLRGPGHPGLQPQSTPVRGNRNTCAWARPAGRERAVETTRPSPSQASWPPAVGSEWNEWGVQTLTEIVRSGGAGPSPGQSGQRPLLPKGTSGASGPAAGAAPGLPCTSLSWEVGRLGRGLLYSAFWAAGILHTNNTQGTCGAGRLVLSINWWLYFELHWRVSHCAEWA